MANDSKTSDQAVLDSLLEVYPGFLREGLCWVPGPDPPDFIAMSANSEHLGLEMTEWLNETRISISNQDLRFKLLTALDSEHSECRTPITRVNICARLDVPFRMQDCASYVREAYQFIHDQIQRWGHNQAFGIWAVVDLSQYPTLAKHCLSISLYGPPRFCNDPGGIDWNPPGSRWIYFEPFGSLYDPQTSAEALLFRIVAKTCKYGSIHHAPNLDRFVLLVHYGIRGIVHNTPYRGRNAKLGDAVKQAHDSLLREHGAFDSVILYMNFNAGKLVQLFSRTLYIARILSPAFATLGRAQHRLEQHPFHDSVQLAHRCCHVLRGQVPVPLRHARRLVA